MPAAMEEAGANRRGRRAGSFRHEREGEVDTGVARAFWKPLEGSRGSGEPEWNSRIWGNLSNLLGSQRQSRGNGEGGGRRSRRGDALCVRCGRAAENTGQVRELGPRVSVVTSRGGHADIGEGHGRTSRGCELSAAGQVIFWFL